MFGKKKKESNFSKLYKLKKTEKHITCLYEQFSEIVDHFNEVVEDVNNMKSEIKNMRSDLEKFTTTLKATHSA